MKNERLEDIYGDDEDWIVNQGNDRETLKIKAKIASEYSWFQKFNKITERKWWWEAQVFNLSPSVCEAIGLPLS